MAENQNMRKKIQELRTRKNYLEKVNKQNVTEMRMNDEQGSIRGSIQKK